MPTLNYGQFTTYYEEAGSGEPVVLICGFTADLQIWRTLSPLLSEKFRVITFDNRGAGRSSAPDEPYTIQGMAEDLASLLDHLEVTSTNIVGWSMGGVVAQSFALSYPSRAKHLVLLGTFTAPDNMFRNAISNWVNIRQSNMSYEQVVRHVARLVFSPSFADNVATYESTIQLIVSNPYRQPLHGFLRQAEALLAYTEPPDLRSLQVPISILVGEHDQLTPGYLSQQLKATFPHATLEVLPGAHSGFLEHPKTYTTTLAAAFEASPS